MTPVTSFICHAQLRIDHTELMCEVSQFVSCDLMVHHQMSLNVRQVDRFLADQAAFSQHTKQITVFPKQVKISCHQGHGNFLKLCAWKEICQKGSQLLCGVGPGNDNLPVEGGCNDCQLQQSDTFMMHGAPPR